MLIQWASEIEATPDPKGLASGTDTFVIHFVFGKISSTYCHGFSPSDCSEGKSIGFLAFHVRVSVHSGALYELYPVLRVCYLFRHCLWALFSPSFGYGLAVFSSLQPVWWVVLSVDTARGLYSGEWLLESYYRSHVWFIHKPQALTHILSFDTI